MQSAFRTYTITFVFVACICFPFFNDRLGIVNDLTSFENRQAKPEPRLDIEHLDGYPRPYEAYYNDHFTLRSLIVNAYCRYKVKVFHQSPVPDKVVMGRGDWLFDAGAELDSYLGRKKFDLAELSAFSRELDRRKQYLDKKGCKLYFLIAPAKTSIYQRYVDARYERVDDQNWGAQLIDYLNVHCSVKPINVYHLLKTRAGVEQVYYKLDSHWNGLGAFIAAQEIMRVMGQDMEDLGALEEEDFYFKKVVHNRGNLQQMMGNLEGFKDFEVKPQPKAGFRAKAVDKTAYPPVEGFAYPEEYENERETGDSTKAKLLIISDSFGHDMFPILAENFGRTVKIFDAWLYELNEEIVEREKPEAMLIVIHEPLLRNFLQQRPKSSKKQPKSGA